MYRIIEIYDGVEHTIARGVKHLEDARVIAFNEDCGEGQIIVEKEKPIEPTDLYTYGGRNAIDLRRQWRKAGRPKYRRP